MNEEFRRFSAAKEGELVFPGEEPGYCLYNSEWSAVETYLCRKYLKLLVLYVHTLAAVREDEDL